MIFVFYSPPIKPDPPAMLRVVEARKAVLVAEDEPQLLRLLTRLLERADYEVLVARDGNTALEAFEAHRERIAIAVMDAAIAPQGCGEILERIGSESPEVGLVLISGDALDGELRTRMLVYDGIFVRKPFVPVALLQAIEDSLVKESI